MVLSMNSQSVILTVGGDIEPNADGISLGPGREAGGLVEGRSEQGLPDLTEAKRFAAITQARIKAVAYPDPLAHAGCMDPEATSAVLGLNVHGRQPRRILLTPSFEQQRRLCGEISPSFGRRGFARAPRVPLDGDEDPPWSAAGLDLPPVRH